MPIYAIVNGATSDQLDVNQYKSWWVDGSLTSQPANMIYSGASAAVSITQNGSGNILALNGTISASVDMAHSGVIQSTPAITATGTVVSIKHIYLKPTMTLANNANAIVRVMTIRGILTLNGTGSPLGSFLDIGNPADSSVILSANAEFDTVQLDYPPVTLNGHVLNANSATLLIASAPSGGFSVRDTSAGKWLTGSGGVTIPGGGMSITGDTSVTGNIILFGVNSIIHPGFSTFAISNYAQNRNNFLLNDSGSLSLYGGVSITQGGMTISSGNVTLSSGYLYIANGNLLLYSMTTGFITDANIMILIPPAVGFQINNHANSLVNISIQDNGVTTFRSGVSISSGGINATGNSVINGTLTGLTGLTVASGGVNITGNSVMNGTLGGLTGLTVAIGGVNITGNSVMNGTLSGLTGLTVASGGINITGNSTITGSIAGLLGITVTANGMSITGASTIIGKLTSPLTFQSGSGTSGGILALSYVEIPITFATTFGSIPRVVAMADGFNPAGSAGCYAAAFAITTSGFTLRIFDTGGNAVSGYCWIAMV